MWRRAATAPSTASRSRCVQAEMRGAFLAGGFGLGTGLLSHITHTELVESRHSPASRLVALDVHYNTLAFFKYNLIRTRMSIVPS